MKTTTKTIIPETLRIYKSKICHLIRLKKENHTKKIAIFMC